MDDRFIMAVAVVVALVAGAAWTHFRYAWEEWRKAVRAVPRLRKVVVLRSRSTVLAAVVLLVVLVTAAHGG